MEKFNIDEVYRLNEEKLVLNSNNEVPLTYWKNTPNFGDLLSPYIFSKLTKRKVSTVNIKPGPDKKQVSNPCYISVGSILSRTQDYSIVWGTGAFGTEQNRQISREAKYYAVRGPLTRCLVRNQGVECPEVYGDPGLLMPYFYFPKVSKTHELGVVLRWSEHEWLNTVPPEGVKIIDLSRSDVEGVIKDILSCERVLTSSLHGLIISDAYRIPNVWLNSESPKGGAFKFHDYYLSTGRARSSVNYSIDKDGIDKEKIFSLYREENYCFGKFDVLKLLDACPFLERK